MTDFEFELEVRSYFELNDYFSGKKKLGPSSDFLEKAKAMQQMMVQGLMQPSLSERVTPEELGWKHGGS